MDESLVVNTLVWSHGDLTKTVKQIIVSKATVDGSASDFCPVPTNC